MSSIEVGYVLKGHMEEVDKGHVIRNEWIYDEPCFLGGIGVKHDIYNATNKTVKYATFTYSAIDRVGGEISSQKHRFTGPLYAKEKKELVTKEIFWDIYEDISYVRIKQIDVEYMDGTQEIILHKDIKSMEDKDSKYNSNTIAEEQEAEEKLLRKKKRKGVVAWAGITEDEDYEKKKIGDITFYIRKEKTYPGYNLWLVGLESSQPIKHLEIPSEELTGVSIREGWEKLGVESVTLPRDLKRVNFMKGYISRYVFDPSEYNVDTLIIPREVEYIRFEKKFLAGVKKIVFEDIEGWGLGGKKLLKDPVRTCKVIKEHEFVEMQKTWLSKLLSKIGL